MMYQGLLDFLRWLKCALRERRFQATTSPNVTYRAVRSSLWQPKKGMRCVSFGLEMRTWRLRKTTQNVERTSEHATAAMRRSQNSQLATGAVKIGEDIGSLTVALIWPRLRKRHPCDEWLRPHQHKPHSRRRIHSDSNQELCSRFKRQGTRTISLGKNYPTRQPWKSF